MKARVSALEPFLRLPRPRQPRSILITALAVCVWIAANSARPVVLQPSCAGDPQAPGFGCNQAAVNRLDRPSLGLNVPDSDLLSFYGQNTSVALAVALPLAHVGWQALSGALPAAGLVSLVALQGQVLLETLAFNGIALELSHFVSHRPRPFVYADPLVQGQDPHHYTSFYSGHTSASAAMLTAALLLLLAQGASLRWLLPALALSQALVMATGFFRILSARHFLTDVLSGAAAGTLIAVAVAWSFRARRQLVSHRTQRAQ